MAIVKLNVFYLNGYSFCHVFWCIYCIICYAYFIVVDNTAYSHIFLFIRIYCRWFNINRKNWIILIYYFWCKRRNTIIDRIYRNLFLVYSYSSVYIYEIIVIVSAAARYNIIFSTNWLSTYIITRYSRFTKSFVKSFAP